MSITYCLYRQQGDEYVQYEALTRSIEHGEPIKIAAGFWGVATARIPYLKKGDLRVDGYFRCVKANPGENMPRGGFADFVEGSGFIGGGTDWRILYESPAGQTYVLLEINPVGGAGTGGGPVPEEVNWSGGELTGIAPADNKIGVDYLTGTLYYKLGNGVWEPVPGLSGPIPSEDLEFVQPVPVNPWIINHNFESDGYILDDVTLYDDAGRTVFSQITHPTGDQTRIDFARPQAGRANLEYHQE